MRILFLHGLGSRPGGFKPTFLREAGFEVANPHLPDEDFAASASRAWESLVTTRPHVVVGSSRGGAVALAIAPMAQALPYVLIAPAWRKWGPAAAMAPSGTIILHAEGDEVIPIEDSRELARVSGLGGDRLRVVGKDHNMTDPEALDALLGAIREAAEFGPGVD